MKRSLVFLLAVILGVLLAAGASADIYINEIMSKNGEFLDHDTPDWIELYNDSDRAVSLEGWYLSDTKKEPMKWAFPKGATIKANGYALIYCVDDAADRTQRVKSQVYFADFKLSSSGETVWLTDPDGNTADKVKYPAQFANVSWGKAVSDGEWGYCGTATPQAKNEDRTCTAMAERPVIDLEAGFYDGPVEVTVTCADPVRYTLDGSEPTADSALYTGPVRIEETSVLKVKAFPEDKVPSYLAFASYFINDPAPVAVVSMSTDKAYLTGKKGLFVSGNGETSNYYQEWEYPICFEYFDENGTRQLAQKGSFRIVGTSTRGAKLKAVAVTARDNYGDPDAFNYNPFDDRDYTSYHTLTIRPTGSDATAARMRDAFLTKLSDGLDIMYQAAKLCIVYYNGEYYGQYFVREKVNKYSVAQWEGVSEKAEIDKIDIVEGEARENQVMNGDRTDWLELREFVRNSDLTVPENLNWVLERLDVESLFTWASYEMLICNTDMENVRVYRVPGGKWKYILYDLDDGMQTMELRAVYMLLDSGRAGGRVSSHYSLLNNLLKVPELKDQFLKRLAFVVENSFLYDGHSRDLADSMIADLETVLRRHFAVNNKSGLDFSTWKGNAKAMKHFLRITPRKVVVEVSKIMGLTNEEQEYYFGRTLELLAEHNSEDKQ